jgi:hypothetical protein
MEMKDDFAHPVEDDIAWGESWYFVFYDPLLNLSLYCGARIRINQGLSEHSMTLVLPDGRLGQVRVEKPQDSITDTLIEGGGMRFEQLEPMTRWGISIDTEIQIVDIGGNDCGSAKFAAEVVFDALAPAIGTDGQGAKKRQEGVTASTAFATGRGHFDQAGQWSGWLKLDGQRWELSPEVTLGMRDKSWGPRRWHVTPAWRIIFVNIDKVTHFGGICMTTDSGVMHRGWVWEDGRRASIANWKLRTEVADDGLTHKTTYLTLTDKEGVEYDLVAEMIRPVHHLMHSGEAPATDESDAKTHGRSVVISGPTRFTYKGRVGYGQMEYMHLLGEDGRPVIPIE